MLATASASAFRATFALFPRPRPQKSALTKRVPHGSADTRFTSAPVDVACSATYRFSKDATASVVGDDAPTPGDDAATLMTTASIAAAPIMLPTPPGPASETVETYHSGT